jgi:hypothetical protein
VLNITLLEELTGCWDIRYEEAKRKGENQMYHVKNLKRFVAGISELQPKRVQLITN